MQNLHVGTIGWSYAFWKGVFYPQKAASKDFLNYYSSKFNTVEVDSTFYRIPNQQTVTNWTKRTPDGFLFSLKFPSLITHIKMLKNCKSETNAFLEKVVLLKQKLGCLLLQFPPAFGAKQFPFLISFLQDLPKEYRYVVEVRNKELLNKEFFSALKSQKVAWAWVDSPNMPLVDEVTSDFLYIRLEGDRSKIKGTLGKIEADTTNSLQVWADKIRPFLFNQMEVFSYFGKYYSGYPPSDVDLLESYLA